MTDYSLESLASFIAFARKRLQDDSAASIEPSIEDGQAAPTELGDDHHDYIATSPPPELRWAWQDLEARIEQGDTIKCIVTGWNRGGLLVRWNRIQGYRELPILVKEMELAVVRKIPVRHASVA